jgi:DNA-binding NtrC family response regulator
MEVSGSVLIVEDDSALRDTLLELLRAEGIEARAVNDVDSALAALEGTEFDVVLSDIQMPVRDGFALVKEIERRGGGPHVILMTSFGGPGRMSRALECGALDYLEKPFSRAQLRAALGRAFLE